uniref:Uncharacterized protein n=1 Tax=Salix viminalis TaxID=40686 RepID=A0A6N2KM38_SALVM
MGSSSTDILEPGLLSPDECWSLFSQFAFFDKNSSERENLEETGRKIAERCFLRETQNPEMEVTGGECFEALAARSFFQDFEKTM